MKKINRYSTKTVLWLGVLALACIIGSCKKNEGFNTEPASTDKTKPGVITNIKVKNFHGGAYITYDLPKLGKYFVRAGKVQYQ
jgi:hypothetical protein